MSWGVGGGFKFPVFSQPLPAYCILGCVEKLKNTKSNYGYSYSIAPWYLETEKA